METLELLTSDGIRLAVPASLQSITTYVLLEQENWFEQEITFLRHWLKPGMMVIDIGANLGVYSLPMALSVGPEGQVFAYEPGSEARALLEQSRDLNAADNLHISPRALSDSPRVGRLVHGTSSELNALGDMSAGDKPGDNGAGENVQVTSLDEEDAEQSWPSPDFVKIDAEGEEERIVAGGRNFFRRHSPLIMFEIKANETVNEKLPALFEAMGYGLYRQIGRMPMLMPIQAGGPLEPSQLNLFAAKADRADALSRQGFLAKTVQTWVPEATGSQKADALRCDQTFASPIKLAGDATAYQDTAYIDSLAAYQVWRNPDRPAAVRCGALWFALDGLRAACARKPAVTRLSTLARVAAEWGALAEGVEILKRLFETLGRDQLTFDEPFLPASEHYDRIPPGNDLHNWFVAAAAEQFERTYSFSSRFSGASPVLDWLCDKPFASSEMDRRRVLIAAVNGERPAIPRKLQSAAADHLNSDVWCTGKVPGTMLAG